MGVESMIHTAYDVMKEFLITDADLDGKYGIPKIPKTFIHPGKDTVDFAESFSRKIKNHRELDVNFYVDDVQFQRLWNQPDKYMEHLKCFHAVIMPDFSISVGKNGMPLVMCLWNKYRNHALAHYMILNDIPVIPNVNILPEYCWDWCFDGLPEGSTVACCTNGRVKSKAARLEFCVGYKEMERRLKPLRVIIVGRIPEELETDMEIINFETRNQKINKESVNGNND